MGSARRDASLMSMKVADILNWGEAHLGEKYANEIDMTRKALRQQAEDHQQLACGSLSMSRRMCVILADLHAS
jgi:hypothetical protein